MPIKPFLEGEAFEPDTIRAMSVALEKVCERLKLSCEASDPITRVVVRKIMELARGGTSDPETLCRRVLKAFDVEDETA